MKERDPRTDGDSRDGGHPSLGRLLDEAAWLRRLARHLVAQPGAADDVVQETWAAVLAQPNRGEILAPRAWLGSIARRIAGRKRRGAGRRAERETEHATRERNDTPRGLDEVAERLELQRIVGEELDGLEEPYRSLLFQQYYEGLAPQEIARRSGLEPGTVRWRAKRGRELLREALVARDGRAWESWAVALAPIAGLQLPASVVTGTAVAPALITMTTKWILGGAVAGALAALGLRAAASEPAPAAPVRVEHDKAEAASAGGARLVPVPNDAHGRSAATVENDPNDARVRSVIGRGRLRSARAGVEIENGTLVFESADGTEIRAQVDGGGWGTLGLTTGEWSVTAGADGHATHTAEVNIPSSAIWDHDIALTPTGTVRVRLEDTTGADLPARFTDYRQLGWSVAVLASEEAFAQSVERPRASWHSSPAAQWRGRWGLDELPHLAPRYLGELHLTAPPPLHVALVVGTEVVLQRRLASADDDLVLRLDPASLERALGSVELRVSDARTGAPAAGERGMKAKLLPGGSYSHAIRMRAVDGVFTADAVPPGDYGLEVGTGESGGDWPYLSNTVRVEAGGVHVLDEVHLPRTSPVRVRVRGEAVLLRSFLSAGGTGDAFAPYRQEAVTAWIEDDGTFLIEGLPPGPVEFVLELQDERRFVFPITAVQENVDVELSLAAAREVEEER